MIDQTTVFIFIGRSGAGKGTQLDLLKKYITEKYSLPTQTLIMGDIYRSFFKEDGFVQNIARDITMHQGKFQPNFLTNALFVRKAIDVLDATSTFFFDGYPRTLDQLHITKELLTYVGRDNIFVINVDVSRESVKKRMLARGRGDDSESAIENRLNEYDDNVVPMLEAIEQDTSLKYIKVDGEPTIEVIHQDLITKIEQYGNV